MKCYTCYDERELALVNGVTLAPCSLIVEHYALLSSLDPLKRASKIIESAGTNVGLATCIQWVNRALRDGLRRVPCPACSATTITQEDLVYADERVTDP